MSLYRQETKIMQTNACNGDYAEVYTGADAQPEMVETYPVFEQIAHGDTISCVTTPMSDENITTITTEGLDSEYTFESVPTFTDIPLTTRAAHAESRCNGTDSLVLLQHDHWIYGYRRGDMTNNFVTNIQHFVDDVSKVVALSYKMNIKDRAKIAIDIGGLMYTTYTKWLTTEDVQDPRFTNLANILAVRQYLGVHEELEFIAENDAVDNFTAYISKCVRGLIGVQVTDITKAAQEIFHKVYDSFISMVSYISDLASTFFARVRDQCIGYVVKNVLTDLVSMAAFVEVREVIVKCILFVSLSLVGTLGIFATSVIYKMMQPIASVNGSVFTAEAEGGVSAIALIMSLLIGSVGLATGDAERVKRTCLMLTALMAGGTVLANVFSTLFVLLPVALRTAFIHKFGSEQQKSDLLIENWRIRAEGILASSKISSVVGTPYYYGQIKTVLAEGQKLISKTHSSTQKTYFFACFTKIFQIAMILNQKHYGSGTRKLPFAFHMSGDPGVGKTLIMQSLIQRAFGESEQNTYTRSNADAFWSGFNCQEVILMDEWGVGDAQYRTDAGKEYLALVSVANYSPPLASIDNPLVGIKGTNARPKIVATLNNTDYDNMPCIDRKALQRRRNCVVRVERRDGSKQTHVDMSKLTPTEIASACWAKFAILPPVANPNYAPKPEDWVDFDTLVKMMRNNYDLHVEQTEAVAKALGGGMNEDKTPVDVMREVMQSMTGIVDTPIDVEPTEADFQVEGGSSSSDDEGMSIDQAVRARYECVHNCCRRRVHKRRDGDPPYSCSNCRVVSPCVTMKPMPDTRPESRVHSLRTYMDACAERWYQSDGVLQFFGFANVELAEPKYKYAHLIGAGVAMVSAIYLVKRVLFDTEEKVTFSVESAKPNKASHQPRKERAQVMTRGFKSEGITDVPRILLTLPDGHKISSTPVFERNVVTYAHAFVPYFVDAEQISMVADINVNGVSEQFEFDLHCDDMFSVKDDDIVMIEIKNRRVPQFRDIRKRFVTNDQISKVDGMKVTARLASGINHGNAKMVFQRGYAAGTGGRTLKRCLLYDAESQEGDCGSLLTAVTGPLAGKIVGMHVAGSAQKGPHNQGLATIVLSEYFTTDVAREQPMQTEGPGINFERLVGPNVETIEYVDAVERVYLPTRSKIQPSEIQNMLSVAPTKEPAILDQRDPRAHGQNPIENSLVDLFAVHHVSVDEELVDKVADSVASQYEQTMNKLVENRRLGFEEAIFGIPGVLASLTTTTSAGWPLCRIVKKGKTELFWFDEAGEPHYAPEFRQMVEERVKEIDSLVEAGDLEVLHNEATKYHKFIGFLKDETISKAKIQDVKTRMIYANDVVAVAAFRMIFGSVLANLNNSFATTPLSIGYNQYSHDINEMYVYLCNNAEVVPNFIAGDYKGYDKHMHPVFLRQAYQIIVRLAGLSQQHFTYLYAHETQTKAQIGPVLFKTVSNHMSGCFFTSIVNCIVNELYMRYCFKKRFPDLLFEENVRCKFLGDDHILAINPKLDWTPLKLGQDMEKIGQVYTSADKGAALRDECDRFEEITFLGAHPRMIHGSWTGAAKKAQLYETPQWTRDNGETTSAVVRQCCELASQWDSEFFYEYQAELRTAMRLKGVEWLPIAGYKELSELVADRKAGTHNTFVSQGFLAEGPAVRGVSGLTDVRTATPATPHNYASKAYVNHAGLGLNEEALDMDYGLNSLVWRQTYDWTSSQVRDVEIFTLKSPHDLLALGDPNNLQNIPFERFIYFHTDVEVTIQIAGTPFQAGLLCLSFTPFDTEMRGKSTDATQMPHVLLSPNRNPTGTLTIPFRYFRNVMNTYAHAEELMGVFTLTVISPLNVTNDDTHVSINIFTRFINAKFTLPRPIPSAAMLAIRKARNAEDPMDWTDSTGRSTMGRGFRAPQPYSSRNVTFIAEGGGVSKTSNVNNYAVKNVYDHTSIGGDVPQQLGGATTSTTRAGASVDADLDVSPTIDIPLPMDNPTMAGSTVPSHQSYSGMSKNRGLKTTTKMGFNHDLDDLHHHELQEPEETNIASLCSRPSIMGVYEWSNIQADATEIATWPLNSLFQLAGVGGASGMSTPLSILNQFRFWRADIEFEFRAIRTSFHNGRLLFTIGYGAPVSEVTSSNRNIFLNNVLEFVGDNDVVSVTVPYNSATEYITTTQGQGVKNAVQDSSMGTVMLTVLNQLKTASTVATSIEVVVYARLRNLEVYEMNPGPTTYLGADDATRPGIIAQPTAAAMRAEGPGDGMESGVQVTEETTQLDQVQSTEVTATETNLAANDPYENDYTRKFPCVTRSIYEVLRRYHRLNTNVFTQRMFKSRTAQSHYMLQVPIMPLSQWCNMYGAWAGSLNYRIYTGESFLNNEGSNTSINSDSISVVINNMVNVVSGPNGTFGPDGDPGWMAGAGFLTQVPFDTSYTIDQTYMDYPAVPVEQRYTTSSTKHWIDVNIPFSTIFQILPTPFVNRSLTTADWSGTIDLSRVSNTTGINPYVGFLGIVLDRPITPENCQVFQSVGDDFRLYGYQAAYGCVQAYNGNSIEPVNGSQINGFTQPNH